MGSRPIQEVRNSFKVEKLLFTSAFTEGNPVNCRRAAIGQEQHLHPVARQDWRGINGCAESHPLWRTAIAIEHRNVAYSLLIIQPVERDPPAILRYGRVS